MQTWFVWYVPRPTTFSKPAMESEVWPVRCRGHAQIRADAHGEAAAQSSSGRARLGSFKRNRVP